MKKRLTKSTTNVVLTGSLAGIGEYFGIDATIIRLIYVLLSFVSGGIPIFLYIAIALIIPSGNKGSQNAYGHGNSYYGKNSYGKSKHGNPYYSNSFDKKRERKQADKIDEDDWSDF